jgi:hypothetical protein
MLNICGGTRKSRDEAVMTRLLVLCVAALVWTQSAPAQEPQCRLYKVQSNSLNISKEPRGDAGYIDTLDNADVVCVTREQKVGERNWGFVDHKLTPDQRKPAAGWANMALLQRLSEAEGASVRGLTASPPAAAAPAAAAAAAATEEIVRFNEPLTSGPYPVKGQSLEQLMLTGIPQFPPIEGLDDALWKKQCTSCHKWDQRTLCEQGATYVKDPKSALRKSHPYGGAEKVAMMEWSKTGCQ